MVSVADEFKTEILPLHNADFREVSGRLAAVLRWMKSREEIKPIVETLERTGRGEELLRESSLHQPPKAATNAEIAAVGLAMMRACQDGDDFFAMAYLNASALDGHHSHQAHSDAALKRYIQPLINYVLRDLGQRQPATLVVPVPAAITESLQRFHRDYPDSSRVGFVMMRFGDTAAHARIEDAIRDALKAHGFLGLLAKDKDYHEDLYPNIQTYLHGCHFGVAVFERVESNEFNPNVSLEVGYMLAQRKPVLLLKDQTLQALQTDLVGKLYKSFDTYDPAASIPPRVEQWLKGKEMI